MWKTFLEFVHQLFLVTEDTNRNKAAIKELQREFKEFSERMEREIQQLRAAIERLAYEVQRTSERERYERENYILRLENRLLRAGFSLPPASDIEDASK
jgi:response regulator RpfG family c-di-GMP phosphodiesterase